MDLLFKRYASPFLLLDEFIKIGRFSQFVTELLNAENTEKDEKALWEYYLVRVWDGSFNSFKEQLENERKNANMTETDIETIVNDSVKTLINFNPEGTEYGNAF